MKPPKETGTLWLTGKPWQRRPGTQRHMNFLAMKNGDTDDGFFARISPHDRNARRYVDADIAVADAVQDANERRPGFRIIAKYGTGWEVFAALIRPSGAPIEKNRLAMRSSRSQSRSNNTGDN